MKQQFNCLFAAKKVIASQLFPQTQIRKPCFRNFDFQACLSISRKGCVPIYMQVKSVDNVYISQLIPKQKNAEITQNFCR